VSASFFLNFSPGVWIITALTTICGVLLTFVFNRGWRLKELIHEKEALITKVEQMKCDVAECSAKYKTTLAECENKHHNEIQRKENEIVKLHKENEKLKTDLEFAEATIKSNQDGYCGSSDRP
jgi:hypothetical protein